jgi:DNA polymerase III epsilon subunit-like protein
MDGAYILVDRSFSCARRKFPGAASAVLRRIALVRMRAIARNVFTLRTTIVDVVRMYDLRMLHQKHRITQAPATRALELLSVRILDFVGSHRGRLRAA